MAHFAHIDENGIVLQVIVVEPHQIASGEFGDPSEWVQTSYNTRGGVHYGPDGQPDGGVALRKNYAGIGDTYDAQRDAFIPAKPFPSWLLNEATCLWEPPVQQPQDEKSYRWDEQTVNWVEVTL